MIYAVIDGAKDWLDGHSLSLEPFEVKNKTCEKNDTVASTSVCKFYLKGKCKFGSQCKNAHPGQSETKKSETQTKKSETQSKTKQVVQEKKNEDDCVDEKKQKMRTATEVISRIQWDPDLPTEDFTVGYLDRFIGIQEKNFSEFSWEDISSVGANVLAVPKHRIQYFKYKDTIVWDKRDQIDNFFGSRGGKTIQEIVSKSEEPSPTAASSDGEWTLLEAETEVELVEGDQHNKRYYSDVNRPTHFICMRVDDENVIAELKKVVSYITKLSPQLSECLINVSALHVTLCMLKLTTDQHIETARKVLNDEKLQFISLLPPCVKLSFTGIDNFRERLIYVKVKPEPALSKFVSHLIERFQAAGLKTPGNHEEYTPHITLAKLSRPKQKELNTNIINPACYQPYIDTSLGYQSVSCIHLCSMHAPAQEDGFYLCYDTINNSLLGLPSSFVTLVSNQVGLLSDMGYVSESERDQLRKDLSTSVETKDDGKFDDVIEELVRLNKEATTFESLVAVQPSVIILRGLPGSGKSYLARNCQEVLSNPSQTAVISADNYFSEDDTYSFNPLTAYKAHQYCLEQFLLALARGCKLIVIDNTNTQLWEYRLYTYLCDVLGYQCYILEIPCLSLSMADMYCNRNVHGLLTPAVTKMYQRWEEDSNRVIAPVDLAYPRDWNPRHRPVYSLLSLCQLQTLSIPSELKSLPLVAVYIGIFLTPESRWQVLANCRPAHSELYASHVTLSFKPTCQQLTNALIGKKVKLQLVGQSDNGRIQAAVVGLPHQLSSQNKTAHITVSAIEGVAPKSANVMLQAKLIRQTQVVYLEGTVGVVVRSATEDEKIGKDSTDEMISDKIFYTIKSPSELKSVLPNILSFDSCNEVSSSDEHKSGILTGEQKITQLFIFDFDGTLFVPPGNFQGRREYEKLTGKKWRRKGWLGWSESLLPPLKTSPGPALGQFHSHVNRAGSYTVVLTGRVENVRLGLNYVLEKSQLFPQKLICKPNITDEATSTFKLRTVKELLAQFPDVTYVKFWDDIPENLAAIESLSRSKGSNIQFEIIDATKMSATHRSIRSESVKMPSLKTTFGSFLQAHLNQHGLLPTLEYQSGVYEGLEFIATQFSKVIDYKGNPLNLLYPFGSQPLNRVSDIDVCIIAPSVHTHIHWLTVLATNLESCGIKYVHVGHSSRCPRLKVLLQFSSTPCIEFDIVVALIPNKEIFENPSEGQVPVLKLAEMREAGDNVSKVALSGPIFLDRIMKVIKNCNVSIELVGAVVEMTIQLLIAKREKGNAYHCVRSFHVVKLLLNFMESFSNETTPTTVDDFDIFFQKFINFVSQMTFDSWTSLCGEFVPEEYIPRLCTIFQETDTRLRESDFPSCEVYEDILSRTTFPPESYTPVEIRISGTNQLMKWKAKMLVEARLPTYIRQLLTVGLDVVSDGNSKCESRFCFAVPQGKSIKETLQQTLRPFWTEMSDIRKSDGLKIQLTFDQPVDAASSNKAIVTDTKVSAVLDSVTEFVSSTNLELHLASNLSAHTRLLVHETAERLGLQHNSVGSGRNRHIVLKK